jgi:hypothetical protein
MRWLPSQHGSRAMRRQFASSLGQVLLGSRTRQRPLCTRSACRGLSLRGSRSVHRTGLARGSSNQLPGSRRTRLPDQCRGPQPTSCTTVPTVRSAQRTTHRVVCNLQHDMWACSAPICRLPCAGLATIQQYCGSIVVGGASVGPPKPLVCGSCARILIGPTGLR